MKKYIFLIICAILLWQGPAIEVESVEVASPTNYCEADCYGNRIMNNNHDRPPYSCYFCQYRCLNSYVNNNCMACMNDINSCQGADYEYKDMDIYAELTDSQLEFMKTTNVIAMGDSIMEGFGNGFWGTADMMGSLYGSAIIADTSASGCLLTNYQAPYTGIPNVYVQLQYIEDTVDLKHLPANSYIVMDGGTNDQLWGYSTLPELTFFMPENGEHDVMYSTEHIVRRILDDTNHSVPIIYIIPCLADMGSLAANEDQINLLKSLQQEGVYVISELDIVNSDDFSDSIHINEMGYIKVTKLVSQIVCEHYGIE